MLRLEEIDLVFNITGIVIDRSRRNQNDLFAIANLMKLAEAVCSGITKSVCLIYKDIFLFRITFQNAVQFAKRHDLCRHIKL